MFVSTKFFPDHSSLLLANRQQIDLEFGVFSALHKRGGFQFGTKVGIYVRRGMCKGSQIYYTWHRSPA